jgi:hypothetical protein
MTHTEDLIFRLRALRHKTAPQCAAERLATELAVAAEREACAKVCEEPGWNAANWCAKAIRARGQA